MQIGELARRAGVSVKTIRYYETIGVLEPAARTTSRYRVYDDNALGQIEFILAGKALGLTLGEIREIVAFRARGEAPCAHVGKLLESRSADLGRRIEELKRMRSVLTGLADRARRLDQRDCAPALICHIIRSDLAPRRDNDRAPGVSSESPPSGPPRHAGSRPTGLAIS